MDDLFYKRLDNFWDYVTPEETKYRFLIRVVRNGGGMTHSHVTISLPEGNTVEVRFATDDHPRYFTDGVVNTIFDDVTRLVHHYFPGREKIECRATFGRKIVNYDWEINRIIRKRGLRCR